MYYPRTLVIANNSFSLTNSNGRTLGNFFTGWPKDCLAQFCLSTDFPNFDLCDNYYCVTDTDALRSFYSFKGAAGYRFKPENFLHQNSLQSRKKKIPRQLFTMFLRHIVWTYGKWKGKSFDKWINDFNPELILLQNGDAPFMLKIGTDLAKVRNIPLVIFNTEGYYFFQQNYMNKGIGDWFWFPLYQKLYRRQFQKTMNQASFVIYGNNLLQEDYSREFEAKSCVLYTSSSVPLSHEKFDLAKPVFSYLGNLSLNRHLGLIEVADVLQSINSNYRLDVYGHVPNAEVERELKVCRGIRFHGSISYDEVKNIIPKSDVLFHVEYAESVTSKCLHYGFSTKIADSISSGRNFFLYSPKEMACAQYILTTQAGWFADTKEVLKKELIHLLNDTEMREKILFNAKVVSVENHSMKKNTMKFHDILYQVVEEYRKKLYSRCH